MKFALAFISGAAFVMAFVDATIAMEINMPPRHDYTPRPWLLAFASVSAAAISLIIERKRRGA